MLYKLFSYYYETKEINKRIHKAIKEMEYSSQFDEIIFNDKLEESKRIAFDYVNKFLNQ